MRQIVVFLVGGLLIAAGAYSATRGLHGLAPVQVILGFVMAIGVGLVIVGIAQWHRKVYC